MYCTHCLSYSYNFRLYDKISEKLADNLVKRVRGWVLGNS